MELQDIQQVSSAYSFLGYVIESEGNVDAIKYLYGNICFEQPPLIKTISLLQDRLTGKEIFQDTKSKYSLEFLYYFGMICMGNASRLIVKNLDTAIVCFKKIIRTVPKAEARLAFIELLLSTDPHKSDKNIRRVEVLRKWAGNHDVFSMIALAKIVYEHFLIENKEDDLIKLPLKTIRLLEMPLQKRHPEAIKFYNAIIENISNSSEAYIPVSKIDESFINANVLYDY